MSNVGKTTLEDWNKLAIFISLRQTYIMNLDKTEWMLDLKLFYLYGFKEKSSSKIINLRFVSKTID